MGQAPTLETPFRRTKSTIKREEREIGRGGGTPPTHKKHQEELSEPCRGPILSDELRSSRLDRVKHRDNLYSYTKT